MKTCYLVKTRFKKINSATFVELKAYYKAFQGFEEENKEINCKFLK